MDHHSDSTLDELAGLFLTDPAARDTPAPAPPREDPLGGPAPIKLAPKVAAPGAKPRVDADIDAPDPFGPSVGDGPDEHLLELLTSAVPLSAQSPTGPGPGGPDHGPPPATDHATPPNETAAHAPALRWTGHDEIDLTNPPRRPEPAQAVTEAVLLGNLPGLAGPWLTQYAQLLAQHQGGRQSVALLHLDGDHLDLELIEPTVHHGHGSPAAQDQRQDQRQDQPQDQPQDQDPAERPPALRIPPGGFGDRDLVDLLDQLCRTGPTPVGTVLLHADPQREPADRLLHFPDWTLVSGADDAALAAATGLMTRLLDHEPRVADTRLGLMVAGSDAEASQHAAQRLAQALDGQLTTAPQLVGYQQQMIPARCRILGSFTGIDALWPRLSAWLAALQPPAAPPVDTAPAAPAAPTLRPTAATTTASRGTDRPGLPPLESPVQVSAARPPAHDPAADHDPAGGQDPAPPDLFALIDTDARTTASIPGGVALEARCPSAPDAQLALDAAGRLHLLLRHDSATGDLPTPREAIVELVAVRTWARQHRQLLQLTERSRRFDPDADPVLHLFTDRADLSVQLVARLGGLLKLHLLRNVAVGQAQTWFCVPLSA